MTGQELGRRIVERHDGRMGAELASMLAELASMLAKSEPEMAGRPLGMAIVEERGGKTGEELAAAMAVEVERQMFGERA